MGLNCPKQFLSVFMVGQVAVDSSRVVFMNLLLIIITIHNFNLLVGIEAVCLSGLLQVGG